MDSITEQIRARINEIAERNGGKIRPDDVVADARDPSSPLHERFEWDVEKAARAHWLDTARELIRAVRVTITTDTTIVTSVAYVRDPSVGSDEQGYVSVTTLRSDEDLAREAIVYEFARAQGALTRAREVAAALNLRNEVDRLIAGVERARAKAERPQRRATENRQNA
jgi:hypothetical protein